MLLGCWRLYRQSRDKKCDGKDSILYNFSIPLFCRKLNGLQVRSSLTCGRPPSHSQGAVTSAEKQGINEHMTKLWLQAVCKK